MYHLYKDRLPLIVLCSAVVKADTVLIVLVPSIVHTIIVINSNLLYFSIIENEIFFMYKKVIK